MNRLRKFFRFLGPGFITGAADDDPSGIGTYSQAGAQFGYGQLWIALFTFPMMVAVQEACGRLGAVTGKGLASLIRERYPKIFLYLLVGLVFVANTLNIGADLGALSAATRLLLPLPHLFLTAFFALTILLLEIFLSYKTYANFLKFLCVSLFAYFFTLLVIRIPILEVFRTTFIPSLQFSFAYLFVIVGVFGTTISPYMFFWQASQETEELKLHHHRPLLKNLRLDTFLGMFFSNFTTWCIIVVTATTLHENGITNIDTAAQAAKALEPLVNSFPNAGFLAKALFATGIIGLGLLGIPILAASAAYALSEAFDWHEGLNKKLKQAPGFYAVIGIATLVGFSINLLGFDPMKMLLYAAVFNGLSAIPLLFVIARLSSDPSLLGQAKNSPISKALLWLTFSVMTASGISLFFAN